MGEQKHTALPWAIHPIAARIVPTAHLSRPLWAHENAAIDREKYAQEICAMHWPDRNRSEQEVRANAELIVHAVNTYPAVADLVEALEKIEYASRKDSLSTEERLASVRLVVTTALNRFHALKAGKGGAQ